MKFEVLIETSGHSSNHLLELSSFLLPSTNQGALQFVFDGKEEEADWAEVRPGVYSLIQGGKSIEVRASASAHARGGNGLYEITVGRSTFHVSLRDWSRRRRSAPTPALDGPREVLAPMPGRVVKVLAAENTDVKTGQGLLVIEAMKMHNELRAPRSGRVSKVYVQEGEGVESGARLMLLTG